jgi:hypothetical protein
MASASTRATLDTTVFGRQHHMVRGGVELVDVMRHQRTVGGIKAGEQHVILLVVAMRGEVRDRAVDHRGQSRVGSGRWPAQCHRVRVQVDQQCHLVPRMYQTGAGDEQRAAGAPVDPPMWRHATMWWPTA